jgi:hypothetical protein
MQCKDISDKDILLFLAYLPPNVSGTWFTGYSNSVANVVPLNTPPKLLVRKMARLITRGLVFGCGCGCRGDYTITAKGCEVIHIIK